MTTEAGGAVARYVQDHKGFLTPHPRGHLVEYTDHERALATERAAREAAEREAEQLRVQLAGCGVIAMCNTRESLATQGQIKPGDYGWSASLGDCLRAAEREIAERERAEAAEAREAALRSRCEGLQRYEVSIAGGCDCCGSWIESEPDRDGDWIKASDLRELLSAGGAGNG